MGETFTGITATICVGSLVIAGVAMSVIMIVLALDAVSESKAIKRLLNYIKMK